MAKHLRRTYPDTRTWAWHLELYDGRFRKNYYSGTPDWLHVPDSMYLAYGHRMGTHSMRDLIVGVGGCEYPVSGVLSGLSQQGGASVMGGEASEF